MYVKWSEFPGNAARYAPENVKALDPGPLTGRHLIFLGSSVTLGARAGHVSFADYIAVRNGCSVTKEAVSGTTLTDDGPDSYVSRLGRIPDGRADLFVCQLSTNDARLGRPPEAVAGAIHHIIDYAQKRWRCPVAFFTCPRFESKAYGDMVALMREIALRRGIGLIDLWNDEAFNRITPEERALWMTDEVHPTRAGHLNWWTPVMERELSRIITET